MTGIDCACLTHKVEVIPLVTAFPLIRPPSLIPDLPAVVLEFPFEMRNLNLSTIEPFLGNL
jgi:hypothetical protein